MTENIVITYDDWHSCSGHDGGGFWTTRLFWDCECEKDYINSKVLPFCPWCAVEADEQPDSRVTEVLEARMAVDVFISLSDALETVYELAEQNALDHDYAQCEGGPLLENSFIQRRSLDVVGDFIANNFGEGDAIVPHFDLVQKYYRIDGAASFNEFFDYKRVAWLITDGLGNLAEVTIMLSHLGEVLILADTINLDEEVE